MRFFILIALSSALAGAQDNNSDPAFFESRVRPVLAAKCYSCHGPSRQFSDLRLDTADGVRKGGQRGPLRESIVAAIRQDGALKMPPGGKLSNNEIEAIEQWASKGLPWPGAAPSSKTKAPHWAFQPLTKPAPQSIDAFLSAKRSAQGLPPSKRADNRTLARRAAFVLTGLPPTPEALKITSWPAYVENLLASPHFGEHWARHWLDLMRFAETYGYEWNYEIHGAWRYRDYLIRAYNNDVPFNQFIREHIAGDLLPNPQPVATAFFRLGEMGHDNCNQFREIRTDVVDNQIDTLTKAFQGVTVSCARCHDHKFDPIPTEDYYSLYGILNSSRPVVQTLNKPHAPNLGALKTQIRAELAQLWLREASAIIGKQIPAQSGLPAPSINFANGLPPGWSASGLGLQQVKAGDFALSTQGSAAIDTIFPNGLATNAATDRWNGSLRSPILPRDKKFLTFQLSGANAAAHRTVMDHCVIGEDHKLIEGSNLHFEKVPTRNDQPLQTYLELNTLTDNPRLPERPGKFKTNPSEKDPRSWFVVTQAWYHNEDDAPKPSEATVAAADVLPGAIHRWLAGEPTTADIFYLNWAIENKLLSNTRDVTPKLEKLTSEFRAIEAKLEAPAVVHGMADLDPGSDYPILLSGQALNPGRPAPRHFLSLMPEKLRQVNPQGSGRLEMAEAIASEENPLTARVYVNRIWRHIFGRGIVSSTDNFGRLSDPPVHPELLDHLAAQFMKNGWSTKKLIRELVLTAAFQQESAASNVAKEKDPQNEYLSYYPVRRLEAESVRDALLAVSGRLDKTLYGPSIQPHRKEPADHRRLFQGPLDGDGRRSIYLKVTRMQGPKFLELFDFPPPLQTRGNRDVTNVPSQALAMLNDPLVLHQAKIWADKLRSAPFDVRLKAMFEAALSRPPTDAELTAYKALAATLGPDPWPHLAHTLFNSKEFLYLP